MKRAALRRSELCAIELLCRQSFSSLYDLSALSPLRLALPVDLAFESFSGFAERTGISFPQNGQCAEGVTVRHSGQYLILYDDRIENKRRLAFTLSHELGHVLLGHTGENEASEEREANAFAASLLSPAIVYHYLCYRDKHPPTPEEMTAIFPLSHEAAVHRCQDLAKRKVSRPADCEITLLLHLFGKLTPTFGQ